MLRAPFYPKGRAATGTSRSARISLPHRESLQSGRLKSTRSTRMRHYEIVFLVHPDQSEQVPAMIERYKGMIAAGGNHALIALDHRGHLLALIRMHQEYDLVMPHSCAPCGFEPPGLKTLPVRQGDTRRARCARRGATLRIKRGAKHTQTAPLLQCWAQRLCLRIKKLSAIAPASGARPRRAACRRPPRRSGSRPPQEIGR